MLSLLYGVLAASAVLCAPTVSLDAATFLQNGMEAQILNAEFASLNASASCDSGEMACIGASVAHCVNSTWTQEACPKSLSCFALPSVREEGTVLSCTTNTTAFSVINASGATGGVAVKSTNGTVDFPMDCDDDDEEDAGDAQSSVVSTASATGTHTRNSVSHTASVSATGTVAASSFTSVPSSTAESSNSGPVTVTVTVVPTSFSTEFSETTTLNPSQASSFLSSIATDTNFSIETTIRGAAPTASASVTSDAASSSAFSSKPVGIASAPAFTSDLGAPTTITLIAAPATAMAASSSAAAKATSAAAIDVGDSYYA
ncbi:hypothetical protein VTO73DRAFT_3687 [Trametes versicolor]